MVSLQSPICDFDLPIVNFNLPDINDKLWSPDTLKGESGLLVMFICNHCPYVKAIIKRIVRDTNQLKKIGINSVAIMSNDPNEYPEDSIENMALIAKQHQFNFPYLFDESQQVARKFGAVCTPDFFGYNSALTLQYRGRLDESRKESAAPNARRDLFIAMSMIAKSNKGPAEQIASVGCSIKWRHA